MSSVSSLKGMISYNWVTDCCAHRVVTQLQLCFALKVEFLIAREEKGERIEKLQYEHFAVETNPKYHTSPLPVMSRDSGVLFSYIRQRVGWKQSQPPKTLHPLAFQSFLVTQTFTAVRSDRSSWILQIPHEEEKTPKNSYILCFWLPNWAWKV